MKKVDKQPSSPENSPRQLPSKSKMRKLPDFNEDEKGNDLVKNSDQQEVLLKVYKMLAQEQHKEIKMLRAELNREKSEIQV